MPLNDSFPYDIQQSQWKIRSNSSVFDPHEQTIQEMNNVYEKFNFPENRVSNMDPPRRRRQPIENFQFLSPPRRIKRIFEEQVIDDQQPVSCPIHQTDESIQCDNQTVGLSRQTTIPQRPVIDCRRHRPKRHPRSDNEADDEFHQAGPPIHQYETVSIY